MANEEVLGPRKTMFVLVIVVGCFAVLWPRILSPLILGNTREQLKPNQFDRDAGCCEVIFGAEMAVLELLNEVCSSAVHVDGKLSPYAAAECRKAVNDTCGVDIAAFLKRSENVGKTSKMLVNTMQRSNSSCLKEHFGVPMFSLTKHQALNSWTLQDTVKQERPAARVGPHPALRERGRAIPAGAPPAPKPVAMPPHVRVRSSPLSVYYELEVKPPPIPGMRPPLGSPGGPVPAPKSSMGFVMPIYTICIIVFFVYTLSKILFKRTGPSHYETITPDPQFRRRVFRDDSRTSPDKLVVTAISGLVAEVQQQMDANYAQSQQRQDAQDNGRPYTNGTIIHNSGPVHIVASEYQEAAKEKSPEVKEFAPEPKESLPEPESPSELKESSPEPKELSPEPKESTPEIETTLEPKESTLEPTETTPEQETTPETKASIPELKESTPEMTESPPELEESTPRPKETTPEPKETTQEPKEQTPEVDIEAAVDNTEEEVPEPEVDGLIKLTENLGVERNGEVLSKSTEDFLREESNISALEKRKEEKQSTPDLLEEAINEDSLEVEDDADQDNASVKVLGMEITAHSADGGSYRAPLPALPLAAAPTRPAHEAEQVQSIYLETEIPQKSRVLVTEFAEDKIDKPTPARNSPMVVSGKMTLSLIQDAPRETPERDPESTLDDFTTASAVTQNAAEKEDDLSDDEDIEEEIEIEEIEEEVSEEEVDVEESDEEEPKKAQQKTGPENK